MCKPVEPSARDARKESLLVPCVAVLAAFTFTVVPAPASAQSVARFSLESAVAVDEFGGESASHRPEVVVDVSMAIRIGDHWQAFVRPWFRLQGPSTPTAPAPDWDKEIYQAGLEYERHVGAHAEVRPRRGHQIRASRCSSPAPA